VMTVGRRITPAPPRRGSDDLAAVATHGRPILLPRAGWRPATSQPADRRRLPCPSPTAATAASSHPAGRRRLDSRQPAQVAPHTRPPPWEARLTPALRPRLHDHVSRPFAWDDAVFQLAPIPFIFDHREATSQAHLLFPFRLVACALELLDEMPQGPCYLILHWFTASAWFQA